MAIFKSVRSRWAVPIGLTPMLALGFLYGFGVYSEKLKAHYNMIPSEIAGLGNASGVVGQYGAQLFSALILPVIGVHYGALIGCIMFATGYFGHYLSYIDVIPYNYNLLWVFSLLIGSSTSFAFVSMLSSTITHTMEHVRSLTVGSVLAVFGVSTLVVTQVYVYFLDARVDLLFLFLGIYGSVSLLLSFVVLRPYTAKVAEGLLDDNEDTIPSSAVVPNGELAASFAASETNTMPNNLLSAPLLGENRPALDAVFTPGRSILTSKNTSTGMTQEEVDAEQEATIIGLEKRGTLMKSLRSPLYIATMLIMLCVVANTLTIIGNCGSILRTFLMNRDGETTVDRGMIIQTTGSTVMLISIANTLGRLVFGGCIDLTGKHFNIGRGAWILLDVILITSASFMVTLGDTLPVLVTGLCLTGFAHGAAFTVMGTFYSEEFPFCLYSAVYSLMMLGPAVGGTIGNKLFGASNNALSHRDPVMPMMNVCSDLECYRPTFRVTGGMLVGIALPFAIFIFIHDYKKRRALKLHRALVAARDNAGVLPESA